MLKSLSLERFERSINPGSDSKTTEWLSCEKQKRLDKTVNTTTKRKKRKHRQVLRNLQLDNLASASVDGGRHSINRRFLSAVSSVTSQPLTQSKLTTFFKQTPKTLPSHRSHKCTNSEDHRFHSYEYLSSGSVGSANLQNKENSTAIENKVLSNFSFYDNYNDSSLDSEDHTCEYSSSDSADLTSLQNKENSTVIENTVLCNNFSSYDNCSDNRYHSPKTISEGELESVSQNLTESCIKEYENLNFFTGNTSTDCVSPVTVGYSQTAEPCCENFDNIEKMAHPPSPMILSQWTEDNLDLD